MTSEKQDVPQGVDVFERNEIWEQVAELATNAVAIVVIAFIIAIICVGGS